MANQYSGRAATEKELMQDEVNALADDVERLKIQIVELIGIMIQEYKQTGSPDLARALLVYGQPVHEIDKQLGRATIYTTARRRLNQLRQLTEGDFYNELDAAISKFGTQKAFAEVCGVSEQFMSDVVNRNRKPNEKILKKMGLKRKTAYVPYGDDFNG